MPGRGNRPYGKAADIQNFPVPQRSVHRKRNAGNTCRIEQIRPRTHERLFLFRTKNFRAHGLQRGRAAHMVEMCVRQEHADGDKRTLLQFFGDSRLSGVYDDGKSLTSVAGHDIGIGGKFFRINLFYFHKIPYDKEVIRCTS